jgi:uncharacterized protein YggT (Ycf19 family)
MYRYSEVFESEQEVKEIVAEIVDAMLKPVRNKLSTIKL